MKTMLMVGCVALLATSGAQAQSKTSRTKPTRTTKSPRAQPAAARNVYYQNCSAARAAGAAPISRGEPGYASKLDRDNDGVACE